jgi:hypothetical protein
VYTVAENSEALRQAVEQARALVQDVMHRESSDPRSQQLIAEALRNAEAALRGARAALAEAEGNDARV